MRIVLAADLHFGSVPERLAATLAESIEGLVPDLVVIAGDLTLRARRVEFEQAKAWLCALAPPALVLPGNHDLPYWNLFQRFSDPFRRYLRALDTDSLMPVFERPNDLVLGFNTTGPWQPHLRWQEGVARLNDIANARAILAAFPDKRFKAIVAHHPLFKVRDIPRAEPVRRAALALRAFAASAVDLIMSGHVHQSYAFEARIGNRTLIIVGAPTALSTRMRGETNGFWQIDARDDGLRCTLWLRGDRGFAPSAEKTFSRAPNSLS